MYDNGEYLTEENFDAGLFSEGISIPTIEEDPWPEEDVYDDE